MSGWPGHIPLPSTVLCLVHCLVGQLYPLASAEVGPLPAACLLMPARGHSGTASACLAWGQFLCHAPSNLPAGNTAVISVVWHPANVRPLPLSGTFSFSQVFTPVKKRN